MRLSLMLAGLFALMACASDKDSTRPGQSTLHQIDQSRTPGVVSAKSAVDIFLAACLSNSPYFVGLGRDLAALKFVQAETGTYYHPTGTVSVKLLDATAKTGAKRLRCSLVYEDPAPQIVTARLTKALRKVGHDKEPQSIPSDGADFKAWALRFKGLPHVLIHRPRESSVSPGQITLDVQPPDA